MTDFEFASHAEVIGAGSQPTGSAAEMSDKLPWSDESSGHNIAEVLESLQGGSEEPSSDAVTEPETDDVVDQVAETVEDPAESHKGLTPEEQSFKDKYYASQEKLNQFLENRQQSLKEPEQSSVQTVDDLANETLKPFVSHFNKLVEDGEMSEHAAKVNYTVTHTLAKEVHSLKQQINEITGQLSGFSGGANANNLISAVRDLGIEANSETEKEVLAVIGSDFGVDISKPETLAQFNDVAGLKKIAHYARLEVQNRQAARNGKQNPKPDLMGGGKVAKQQPKPNGKAEPQKFNSISDISRAAKGGRL